MSVKDALRRWLDWLVEPEHVPPPGRHRLGRPPEPKESDFDPDAIYEGHYPDDYGEEVAG